MRQSRLSSFDQCALLSHFEEEHERNWDSHPQGRGKLTHEVLAKCLEEMHRQGETRIEVDVALAILHEVLRQADVDDVCHEPGCDLPARLAPPSKRRKDGRVLVCAAGHRHHSGVVTVPMRELKDVYWIVKKWAYDNEFDISHLVDVERRLEVRVTYPDPEGGSTERLLTGQLDALFLDPEDSAHAIVLDFKDTWALPAPTEVSFEGYFQQRFYALLVMRNFPSIQKVTLREFYVRYSEPREAVIERDTLSDIEAEMSALAERFDRAYHNRHWKPTPGRHCNFCPRPAACPIPVFVRGEGRIIDEGHAEKVAAQLLVAEVVVNQSRKALRAYVDVNGPVPVKDAKGKTEWGYREIERESKPTAEQVREALRMGIDPVTLYKKRKGTRFERYTLKPGEAEEEAASLAAALKASVEQRDESG